MRALPLALCAYSVPVWAAVGCASRCELMTVEQERLRRGDPGTASLRRDPRHTSYWRVRWRVAQCCRPRATVPRLFRSSLPVVGEHPLPEGPHACGTKTSRTTAHQMTRGSRPVTSRSSGSSRSFHRPRTTWYPSAVSSRTATSDSSPANRSPCRSMMSWMLRAGS